MVVGERLTCWLGVGHMPPVPHLLAGRGSHASGASPAGWAWVPPVPHLRLGVGHMPPVPHLLAVRGSHASSASPAGWAWVTCLQCLRVRAHRLTQAEALQVQAVHRPGGGGGGEGVVWLHAPGWAAHACTHAAAYTPLH